MRILFAMDKKDYAGCTHEYVRHSARGIIIRDGKVAMVHSRKYDYYKFPGGGIEKSEDPVQAMIRETREEAGLIVRPETVREYGCVPRRQRSETDETECFVQDNFYYICQAEDASAGQQLDAYEADEGFSLVFVDPAEAIAKNRSAVKSDFSRTMLEREARVLEMLTEEGFFRSETECGQEKNG